MRRRKNVLGKLMAAAIVSLAWIAASPSQVKAETLQDLAPQTAEPRSLLDEVETVSDEFSILQRNGHLAYGQISLTKLSPTRASVFGTTQAFHTCQTLELDLYVDQYNTKTGKWSQWRYWEFFGNNGQNLTKSLEIIVQSGYYYSVRGYHICIHGDVMETAETITDGMYIGITDKPVN